jgi:hypothetical protein
VNYNTTYFYQAVGLETAAEAGTHLVVPSLSFTLSSALAGFLIGRLKTPAPTLHASQVLLVLGTITLAYCAILFPSFSGAWKILFSLGLALPAFGSGMMAPSVVLTLLQLSKEEDQAVASGALILMRSLGVSISTALSTTIVQNVFQFAFPGEGNSHATNLVGKLKHKLCYSVANIMKKIEAVREDIRLILELDKQLKSQGMRKIYSLPFPKTTMLTDTVVRAYSYAFMALFGICACAALLIVGLLARVKITKFRAEEKGDQSQQDQ